MSELQYLAGFFDGEGCISIHRHQDKKTKRGYVLVPRITVANTRQEVVEWFKPFGFSVRRTKNGKNSKDVYRIELERLSVIQRFLQELSPFLRLKKKQADLLLEFCSSRLEDKTYCYTQRELKIRDELSELNMRGVY